MIRIGIFGATGYTGLELLKLLVRHPAARTAWLTSESSAGQQFGDVFPVPPALGGHTLIPSAEADCAGVDVVFCCLPHVAAQTHVAAARRAGVRAIVNVGIVAFLPESHADVRTVREPDKLVGQTFKFKVIKFDRKTENAVLSRKLFLQDEREKKKRRVFGKLVKGERIKGQVRSLTSFGAFVDIGGIEGLLHISVIAATPGKKNQSWHGEQTFYRGR